MWFGEPSDLHSTSWMPAFEDGACSTTSDNTGTGSSWLDQYAACAHLSKDRVNDRRASDGHGEQVSLGFLGALLNCEGHLFCLAVAETNLAFAVTDYHEGGEAETTTTLDDLGDTIDMDDPRITQAAIVVIAAVVAIVVSVVAIVVVFVRHQNSSPASRAASAKAAIRP